MARGVRDIAQRKVGKTMKMTRLQILVSLLVIAFVACLAWIRFAYFEQRTEAQFRDSVAAIKDPMLAAVRLLDSHHHPTGAHATLSLALSQKLPRGTMILVDNSGALTAPQVDQLLAWVAQGNTLIAEPNWSKQEADAENSGVRTKNADQALHQPEVVARGNSLAVRFKIWQKPVPPGVCRRPWKASPFQREKAVDCIAQVKLPGAAYPLRVDVSTARLWSNDDSLVPLFADEDGAAVRAYMHGKGRIVFVAHNYFDNFNLTLYDHAELLLGLTDLNREASAVSIVHHLDIPSWYRAIWTMLPFTLGSLGVALLLLGWSAARRFGPMLPEPNPERRALMEHVDASGRWLWKTGKGREILLAAARTATDRILSRRAPELQRLSIEKRIPHLAQQCQLKPADLDGALLAPAAHLPAQFALQVKTLQRLRKHYER